MKLKVRHLREGDHNFVYASYLRNRWFDKNNKTTLKRSTWSSLQHRRLEDLMKNPSSVSLVCLDEDEDTILGYGLQDHDGPFIYIKLPWRSEGLGVKKLLERSLVK